MNFLSVHRVALSRATSPRLGMRFRKMCSNWRNSNMIVSIIIIICRCWRLFTEWKVNWNQSNGCRPVANSPVRSWQVLAPRTAESLIGLLNECKINEKLLKAEHSIAQVLMATLMKWTLDFYFPIAPFRYPPAHLACLLFFLAISLVSWTFVSLCTCLL